MTSNYKVIKLLGEGSFGKAFLCKNESNNRICVIKQIVIEDMNQKEKDDAYNEAQILGKLDHPNIIKLLEVFDSKKPKHALNIVTEYADGGDLSEKIKSQNKKPFTESEILNYFTQICLALKHIHEKKIIHRDLKSSNIFLMKNGLIKLGDFGISKGFQNTMEKAKTMVGTPYYLSPEILENKPYDAKSDIWALGVLLYEMMTFKMPFSANSFPILVVKILRGNYTPPPTIYSKDLREIIDKCLIVDYRKRPAIQQILNFPIIQDRIKLFFDEIQYNKEFSKTLDKKFKEKQKIKSKENSNSINDESPPSNINGITIKKFNFNRHPNNNIKIKEGFKQNFNKNETKEKEREKNHQEFKDNLDNTKKESNFGLAHQSKSNEKEAIWEKIQENQRSLSKNMSKDNENDKTNELIQSNNLNDLIESYELNKINEEDYDKLRNWNDLNRQINPKKEEKGSYNEGQDIDNKKEIKNNDSEIIIKEGYDINCEEKRKNIKKVDSDNEEEYIISEYRDIELMRIELENSLNNDILKVAYHIVDNATDRKEIKFDRDKVEEKIKSIFKMKGFSEKEIYATIQKIPEIFAIILKERIIEQ